MVWGYLKLSVRPRGELRRPHSDDLLLWDVSKLGQNSTLSVHFIQPSGGILPGHICMGNGIRSQLHVLIGQPLDGVIIRPFVRDKECSLDRAAVRISGNFD